MTMKEFTILAVDDERAITAYLQVALSSRCNVITTNSSNANLSANARSLLLTVAALPTKALAFNASKAICSAGE